MAANTAAWWAVTIDSIDPPALAQFWSEMFDTPLISLGGARDGWYRLQPLGPQTPFINFQPVSDDKVAKVRIHLDVFVGDLEDGVARAVALGATDTESRETLPRGQIAIMLDPEGNEFCVLAAPSAQRQAEQ